MFHDGVLVTFQEGFEVVKFQLGDWVEFHDGELVMFQEGELVTFHDGELVEFQEGYSVVSFKIED